MERLFDLYERMEGTMSGATNDDFLPYYHVVHHWCPEPRFLGKHGIETYKVTCCGKHALVYPYSPPDPQQVTCPVCQKVIADHAAAVLVPESTADHGWSPLPAHCLNPAYLMNTPAAHGKRTVTIRWRCPLHPYSKERKPA